VNDLLCYARPKPPKLQAVDARLAAQEAAASARAAVGATCPPIALPDVTATVLADPEMLRAVLLNLTINACQAADHAPVEIDIVPSPGSCRLSVSDRGPGIPPEIRERIFEPFFTTRAGGTGLGLAIVKRLMEVQGGTVVLTERPGGGTVAELTVPLARQRA
jgi:signal transduction histidine kinase